MDITSNAGSTGGFSFEDSSHSNHLPSTGRGRVRGDDFGLPKRAGLIDLAHAYRDAQARLWPELVGTPAVPIAMPVTVEPMAVDFERRFRQQHAEVFRPNGTPRAWTDLGIAYLRFSDEGSNRRSLDQQLNNVLNRARRDGVFIPWQYVCADAAVSGTLSCRRGYAIAKTLVERRAETGAAWFVIDDLSRISRNTIESLRLGELAADTGVRVIGASDGFDSAGQQSKIMLPMMSSFNEVFIDQLKAKVKRGMDDAFLRGENIQPPGVGYRMVAVTNPDGSLLFTHKGTVEKRAEIDPEAAEWIRRGAEMIAHEGKSPIDIARLFNEQKVGGKATWSDNRAVAAEIFSERFIAALTTDVNVILAAAAKRPVGATKKLEQEIANRERQIARLTARLDKVADAGGLDAIFDKVAEMERELQAKRAELAEQQRLNRRPPVKRVKEKDVTAALTQLRQLLQSDVGLAAPVLKELIGDIVIESRIVEGEAKPQMFARFTINALPAPAAIGRGTVVDPDGSSVAACCSILASPNAVPARAAGLTGAIVPLIYDRRAAAQKPLKTLPKS